MGSFFPTVDILSKDGVTGTDTLAILTTIGIDPFTYGNLLNKSWGNYKQLSSNNVLTYQANNPLAGEATKKYTFTAPTWTPFNDLASTWQMLLSVRWSF